MKLYLLVLDVHQQQEGVPYQFIVRAENEHQARDLVTYVFGGYVNPKKYDPWVWYSNNVDVEELSVNGFAEVITMA